MRFAKSIDTAISNEQIAPEINPNVSMILFMFISWDLPVNLPHHTAPAGVPVVILSDDFRQKEKNHSSG
jgi:peroxiredoxin